MSSPHHPRGIAVTDVGYTNTKVVLFGPDGLPLAERKMPSRQSDGPPYRHIDERPLADFFASVLPEFDRILPVDVIVPSAHGAAMALLAADGSLAMPVMDYTVEPPSDIVDRYRKVMPSFAETLCPLLPMALTHGLQMFWQQQLMPEAFARVTTAITWIQYIGFLLSGRAVTEITSLGCQTHLLDARNGGLSSLVKSQGWEQLFPPMAKSWDVLGPLLQRFRGKAFRGRGEVLAGIHDSSANYVRYQAAGLGHFSLLSSGTWVIAFDSTTPIQALQEDHDTAANVSIFGKPIAISRFFGGKEFEVLAGTAADQVPTLAAVEALVQAGIFALPAFTGSPGPKPGTAHRGRIIGDPGSADMRVSLASLYCALMASAQLDLLQSRGDIIVDGPFAVNAVFLAVLAQLRPAQKVFASDLRDGTTAGAACLALMSGGNLPRIALSLVPVAPSAITELAAYHQSWKDMTDANRS